MLYREFHIDCSLYEGENSTMENELKPIYVTGGEVIHGRGLGNTIGLPTANLRIPNDGKLPELGVYASKILIDGRVFFGLTHIGTRPTVDSDSHVSIETHIIDFADEIYGRRIEVKLYKKLRDVCKFDSTALLLKQIEADRAAARRFWNR